MDYARLDGKACGGCTACCQFPPIRSATLQKPSNTLCPHCEAGRGCTVYERRPTECRGWYCGWFYIPGLGPHWHPDRSGVVLRPEALERNEVTIVIMRLSAFLLSQDFAETISVWVDAGVGIHFERLGPPGHLPAKMAMNSVLQSALATKDMREVHKTFSWAIAQLDAHQWEADGIVPASTI